MQRSDKLRNTAQLDNLIKLYLLGLSHGNILLLLNTVDDLVISTCILRRILKCVGLYRRKSLTVGGCVISH